MRRSLVIVLAGALSLAADVAVAQPPMVFGNPIHGMPGVMGPAWAGGDIAGYLSQLKLALGVTAAQEPAWNQYAKTLSDASEQVRGAHQTMFDAMGTASWTERRDMMNRMLQTRDQAFDQVHTAAQALLPSLDPAQRNKAANQLPGLAPRGYGMMGQRPRSP
jgi:hypothetical protein